MNIMIVANSRYILTTIVMLYSLYENNPGKITVYLLYSDMQEEEISRLCAFTQTWMDKQLIPVRIKREDTQKLFPSEHMPIETYYRILGMELLPQSVKRVMYLDIDIVVNKSLEHFYHMDMEGRPLAACQDIYGYVYGVAEDNKRRLEMPEDCLYFNAGVMLYDLEQIREEKLMQQTLDYVYQNYLQLRYMDQDALNKVFLHRVKIVDWYHYNCTPILYVCSKQEVAIGQYAPVSQQEIGQVQGQEQDYLDMTQAFYQEASIIHYIGETKPWNEQRVAAKTYELFDQSFYNYMDRAVDRYVQQG